MKMQKIIDEFLTKMGNPDFMEDCDSVAWGALRAAQAALEVANDYGEFGDDG